MSYQVRHKNLGVFQGSFLGLLFFTQNNPEVKLKDQDSYGQGLCEFLSMESAEGFLEFLSREWSMPYHRQDFFIAPFDKDLHSLWLGLH